MEGEECSKETAVTVLDRMPEHEEGHPAVREAGDSVIEEIR